METVNIQTITRGFRKDDGGALIDKELAHDPDIDRKSNTLAVMAIISVLLYVAHMEINFNSDRRYMENSTASSYVTRFLMSVVTALLLCCLFDYYQLMVYVYRKYQTPNQEEMSGFWPNKFLYPFLVEMCVCFIHPIPGLLNNKIGAFMLVRIYLLLNLVRNSSEIYTKRGIVYRSGHLKRGGERVDLTLCIKLRIDQTPGLCLGVFSLLLLGLMSYANYICEREGLSGGDLTYWKAAWSTSFLMFRGISKVTTDNTAGRLIELATGLIGVGVLAIVVAIVTQSMEVSETEQFARSWMARRKNRKKMEVYAAELIQAQWRLHQLRVKCPDEVTMEVQLFFESLIKRHRKYREECDSLENLSLDVRHDKVLAISRKLAVTERELEFIKDEQDAMMVCFERIDDKMT